ncbi:hypothetical protein [Streptomyces sp. NPDC055058]
MSLRPVRFLTCDKPGCRARFIHGTNARLTPPTVLRHEARAAGWSGKDGRDFCPDHEPWPGLAAWATSPTASSPPAPDTGAPARATYDTPRTGT